MTAAVDYFAIEEAIAAQIKNDSAVAALNPIVAVEEIVELGEGPRIFVVLDRRRAPEEQQTINAGTRTRMFLEISVWCYAFALTIKTAMQARDNLMGLVELALMRDRTFGRSDVNTSWLTGGEFDTAKDERGFNVGGEIALTVDVTAVT